MAFGTEEPGICRDIGTGPAASPTTMAACARWPALSLRKNRLTEPELLRDQAASCCDSVSLQGIGNNRCCEFQHFINELLLTALCYNLIRMTDILSTSDFRINSFTRASTMLARKD
jgi:hypothetical protein